MNLAQQIILTIALLKIFFNIIMTSVKEEMSPIEIIIRHTETMISYLIIAVIVNVSRET